MTARTRDRLIPLAVATTVVAGAAVAVTFSSTPLSRDRGFAVVTPEDGADVGSRFLLSWAAGSAAAPGGYAVVVDGAVPAPSEQVPAGPRTLLLPGTSLRLSLGPASTGSPSARRVHTVQVVRLDDSGRRLGEDVAVVHVRTRP